MWKTIQKKGTFEATYHHGTYQYKVCLQPMRKAIQKNRKVERTSEKELYQHQIINCIFYHDFFLASNICTIR